jgi:spermidine synthase
VSPLFEELDFRQTPLGELALRRRAEPRLADRVVYEVKLGDAFLMSSLFTAGEQALATLGLDAVAWHGEADLDVVVGGLGLGYTAQAALAHPRLRSLLVVEYLGPVIEWHRRGLVPLGARLTGDPRCRLVNGDFFGLATGAGEGFDHETPGRCFHAVLLDVDHSPEHLLSGAHAAFYARDGLAALTRFLAPGGVFAMWSNDPPDDAYTARLGSVFAAVDAHVVRFDNPYTGGQAACTVYVARREA